MKRLFIFSALFLSIVGCNQVKTNDTPIEDDSPIQSVVEAIDTLSLQLHYLDSISNSGKLMHIDIYKIGKFKSIEFSVQSVDVEGSKYSYINLRKDCGNDYYYNWEDARILPAECQYLFKAIESIQENSKRSTDHEERYAYVTKDDIRIFAVNTGGSKWTIALSVDYRKERAEVNLTNDELDRFVSLINQCQEKLDELK